MKYRGEIDGLRALAVISVVLFHAQISLLHTSLFPGGFVGVDIFFVISGYLITKIILSKLAKSLLGHGLNLRIKPNATSC